MQIYIPTYKRFTPCLLFNRLCQTQDSEEDIRVAFGAFDQDKDGTVSLKELKSMMSKLGHNLSSEEVEDIFKALDTNGDGQVRSLTKDECSLLPHVQ